MRSKRQVRAMFRQVSVEALENRQLLSASTVMVFDTFEPPVAPVNLTAIAGKRFHDVVGTLERHRRRARQEQRRHRASPSSTGATAKHPAGQVQCRMMGAAWFKSPAPTHGTPRELSRRALKSKSIRKGIRPSSPISVRAMGAWLSHPSRTRFRVKGTFTGTYTTPLGNPGCAELRLHGHRHSRARWGRASLDGTITPPGFILSAPASGELTLRQAPNGTVTLDLTGKPAARRQPGPAEDDIRDVRQHGGAFVNGEAKGSWSRSRFDTTANTFVMVIRLVAARGRSPARATCLADLARDRGVRSDEY